MTKRFVAVTKLFCKQWLTKKLIFVNNDIQIIFKLVSW